MYVYIFSVATQRCLELVYVRVPTPGLEWEHSCVAAVFVHFVVVVVVAFFFFFFGQHVLSVLVFGFAYILLLQCAGGP